MSFEEFVDDVEQLSKVETNVQRLAAEVERRLEGLLGTPEFLADEYRRPGPDQPRSHVIYVSPSKTFSVVSLVWGPGQATCIHDHVSWCVVGVLQGLERETRFQLMRGEEGEQWLEPLGENLLGPGHTCALVPPEEDVHQVRNAGDGTAISIHVYGADIATLGSSINHRFELPVRSAAGGSVMSWRESVKAVTG